MVANKKFFEKLRHHSEIKLRILEGFIPPWSSKLGSKVRRRGASLIWYVDGFAGAGRYDDGAAGSPLIGARRAQEVFAQARGHTLGCINVELDAGRFEQLRGYLGEFTDIGFPIHNLQGAFADQIPEIMGTVGEDSPILVFVDPFGLKALDFDLLRPLLARRGEIDLILTFQDQAVPRLATEHPGVVSRAVGSDEWLAGDQRVESVLEVLSANLKQAGRFKRVVRYPIRERKDGAIKYHLMMASRSYDAFELLNDSVCTEEEALDWRAYGSTSQRSFLDLVDKEKERDALVSAILDFGNEQGRTRRRDIIGHLVLGDWGTWHTREMREAVKALIKSGQAKNLTQESIDTDLLDFTEPSPQGT